MQLRSISRIIFAILLIANSYLTIAQVKYSNEFLSLGVGARSLGMSNASVSNVDDVTSGYWNPAGLLSIKNNLQVAGMHAEYFAGIAKYDYAAISARIDSNSVGSFSFIRFGVDNIPNTTQLIDANGNVDYDKITTFSAADYAFMFSYARKVKIPGLRIGGTAKVIRRKVGDFGGSWGFGIDAGAQYDYKNWKLGVMLRDVTSTFNAWSYDLSDDIKKVFVATNNQLPDNSVEVTLPRMILGGGRKFNFGEKVSLLTELNLDMTFDGKRNTLIKTSFASADPRLGLEAGYAGFVFLRAGIGNFQTVKDISGQSGLTVQPNFGVGIRFKSVSLDYALTNIGEAVGLYSNIFSLRLDINKRSR